MRINLDKLLKREIEKIDLNFSEKVDTINYCDNIYRLTSPLNIVGKISTNNKGIYIDVNVDFTILDNCGRCLEEVEAPINYSIQGFLVKEDYAEDDFEDYDAFIIESSDLDLLNIIEQTLDFNMPAISLCNEDCQGLCQGCGVNLNKTNCSCSEIANDEEIIDPRFAKLKDLFKND
ncbi:MAG: YceD family protein [Romboutsia sp.]|uniref:YceD family protein n=1 Tax=Romboutsia sp. TaxID=1965302 RepID=UPI003F30AE8E